MISYTAKINIPYRYGLMLYPAQFIFLILSFVFIRDKLLSSSKKNFLNKLFSSLVGLNAAFYVVFVISFFNVIQSTGLSYHGSIQNYEFNLAQKKEIISKLPVNKNLKRRDYSKLHGRMVDRMRLHEYDWPYLEYWGGIDRTVSSVNSKETHKLYYYDHDKSSVFVKQLDDSDIGDFISGYFVSSNNLHIPIQKTEIEFMPRFELKRQDIKQMVLNYQLSAKKTSFCFDFDGSKPIRLYEFEKILINGKESKPARSLSGEWLVLNKECFDTSLAPLAEDGKFNKIEIYLKVLDGIRGTASRVNLYAVPLNLIDDTTKFF